MLDPLSAFDKIKEFYITYLETAFRIGCPELQQQRRELLNKVGQLCTSLYLEPIPRYKSSGIYLDAAKPGFSLQGFSDADLQAFIDLALSGLFGKDEKDPGRSKFPLYQHQLDMLERGVQRGKPGIVTSGTGSGKTEAFLLPLLARLAQEARTWGAPNPGYLDTCWWDSEEQQSFEFHRQHESSSRPKAVRALILYPMNALVEDQMVRLRKSLDSAEARQTYQQHFNGNRIFFGRYTGASPVTGFKTHPRRSSKKDEKDKRKAKCKRLQNVLMDLGETQKYCSQPGLDPEVRFNFANPSGSELVSRWDMQSTPPDILITNIAMLNGMLAREVEEPIWESTRDWLEQDPEAYFYLILDELHLQRGSAGTEFCYLLRVLLNRLGLDQPDRRHKLHILASSASLPMTGAERATSLDYLWDMFGSFGLSDGQASPAPTQASWQGAVIAGDEEPAVAPLQASLSTDIFSEANDLWSQKMDGEIDAKNLNPTIDSDQEKLWRQLADGLGIADSADLGLEELVQKAVQQASLVMIHHSDTLAGSSTKRATSTDELAENIFSDGDTETKATALKGLLKVRGWGDQFSEWFNGHSVAAVVPTFRAHSFLRAISGLFCGPQAIPQGSSQNLTPAEKYQSFYADVGVERGLLYSGGQNKVRKVEMLYCECCGDLFYGGMRAPLGVYEDPELMPSDPDLDMLPELARDSLFENLSAQQYAIFWPTVIDSKRPKQLPEDGAWVPADYDPYSSSVTQSPQPKKDSISGYLYNPGALSWRKRPGWFVEREDPGSATPRQCPSCGTNYGKRGKGYGGSSPIRNFRAGFGKTSQLIASELFHQLRLGQKKEERTKLICFTDSRQEAARTALAIESGHHLDVTRELLVECLRKERGSIPPKVDLPNLIENERNRQKQAVVQNDLIAAGESQKEENRLAGLLNCYPDTVPIADVVLPKTGSLFPPPFLRRLAELGMHPTDKVGTKEIEGDSAEDKDFAWQELYQLDDNDDIVWRKPSPAVNDHDLKVARQYIHEKIRKNVQRVIFAKNYFALEEAGLAYGAFALTSGKTRSAFLKHDAMLRVIQDRYRAKPHPFENPPGKWDRPIDLGRKNKVREIFEELYPGSADQEIQEFLDVMVSQNHTQGFLDMNHLHVKLAEPDDPYWRCENCGRVHLHRGFEHCTRCLEPLPNSTTGTCAQLQQENFLGLRLNSGCADRIRAEELTGMTDDTSARLRRFKDVFISDTDTSLPRGKELDDVPEKLEKSAKTIDVLSVTTTLEVGVDIGNLQGTYQANMPPQRFNYQQRVGRAGRRGQAYSLVLTMCRNKSHDLFYFRHPEMITGDPPPPPFLTKDQKRIVSRLARKAWLGRAFVELRNTLPPATDWPADGMRPDIHGEFFEVGKLQVDPQERLRWKTDLSKALQSTLSFRDEVVSVLVEDSSVPAAEILADLDVANVVDEIWGKEGVLKRARPDLGLAQALAEYGYFPLYGLPTTARNLYTGFKNENERWEPVAIDRDAETAVGEFAPLSHLLKDKKIHEVIGFSGSYPIQLPEYRKTHPLAPAFQETFKLYSCDICGSWNKDSGKSSPRCAGCGSPLGGNLEEFKVPNSYRTDLQGGVHPDEYDALGADTGSKKTIKAQATQVNLKKAGNGPGNLNVAIEEQCEIYSLNRGPQNLGWEMQFGKTKYRVDGREHVFPNQIVVTSKPGRDFIGDQQRGSQPVQIGSRKVTDSLFFAPVKTASFDFFHNGHQFKNSIRAALISAAYLIANKAAMILDIDPAEFEIHEPRAHGQDPNIVPLIQIADKLVNGGGFCRDLVKGRSGGASHLESIITSLTSKSADPLITDMLEPDHVRNCANSCYLCLQRYNNQQYHGLLDWRLGLDYLSFLQSPGFKAGLDGKFDDFFGIRDWMDRAREQAAILARLWEGKVVVLDNTIGLFGVENSTNPDQLAFIVHPFWDENATEIQAVIPSQYAAREPVNIFDLTRRPMSQLRWLNDQFSKQKSP